MPPKYGLTSDEAALRNIVCPDCGAPGFACRPNPTGPGVQIIREEDMAAGEMVELTHRVYLNADKTAAVEDGSEFSRWLLGSEGFKLPKDQADALGLVEGEDYGEVHSAMSVIMEQEMANRNAMANTAATIVEPAPIFTATTPERRTFHRETGERIDTDIIGRNDSLPLTIEEERQRSDPMGAGNDSGMLAGSVGGTVTQPSQVNPEPHGEESVSSHPNPPSGSTSSKAQSAPASTRSVQAPASTRERSKPDTKSDESEEDSE